jgi:hypothetical protein
MNELQQLPDMTLEEAQVKHAELKALESVMRSSLLEMRDRKGWKVLGYSSWAEYGETEWGYGRQYLDRLATASRIQQIVAPIGASDIPESNLRPLGKVPDADKSAVYEEAVERALAEGKKLGAKMMEDVVAEYFAKNQTMQQRLDWLEINKEAITQQNDQLRNDLATKVELKVNERISETRAMLILENQQALAEAKRIAENAKDELQRLKKDQEKAIKDGIFSEIQKRKTEIDQLEYRVESLQKQTADLIQARDLLDTENGIIKQHQDSIKDVGGAIQDIKAALYLANESGSIPIELMNTWHSLHAAFTELAKEFNAFCSRSSNGMVIDGNALASNSADDFDDLSFIAWGNA